ncbi:MAG: transposase [Verrucomicrobiaceae bacterium]|nr:transposase [Verrucomicrobiaceae bacterium]
MRLSREHPRYGYRRIAALLRREGERINVKCVARVRREEGLQVRKRQRRMRRVRLGQQGRQGCGASQSRVELGLCERPGGGRQRLSHPHLDRRAHAWSATPRMWRGRSAPRTCLACWSLRCASTARLSTSAATTGLSSSRMRSRTGCSIDTSR